jgi:hypothetical protein
MKKVFEMIVKLEKKNRWTNLTEDLKGYFVQKENSNNEFIGYVEETYDSKLVTRYVKGLYFKESQKLLFFKMANNKEKGPSFFVFSDIAQDGFWSYYDLLKADAFVGNVAEGHARAVIEEIGGDVSKIAKDIERVYRQIEPLLTLDIILREKDMKVFEKYFDIKNFEGIIE